MTAVVDGQQAGASVGSARAGDGSLVPDVGRGWYPQDVESHRRDAPRYCPHCAAPLSLAEGGHGLATEYWSAHERVFVCCCGDCGWYGDIVLSDRVVTHEAEH